MKLSINRPTQIGDEINALQKRPTTPTVKNRKWLGMKAKLMICVGRKTDQLAKRVGTYVCVGEEEGQS